MLHAKMRRQTALAPCTVRRVTAAIAIVSVGVTGFGCSWGHAEESEPKPGIEVPFDSEEYEEDFNIGRGEHNSIVSDPVARERSVLRVGIPEGSHYGASMQVPMRETFGEEPEEATARYWLYVPGDFAFHERHGGGKLPGFTGRYGEAGWGGRRADGTNGWSARMGFQPPHEGLDEDVGLSFYIYHADMGQWGDTDQWEEGANKGEWRQIDQYVRMNTPGEHDGVLRGWVNGELVFERDDLLFRQAGYEHLRIEELYFNIYYGGSWSSPVDTAFYFRDLKIWPGREVAP
ncbi:MAG: polysaccharide lyase [Candidatus Hydrogenedentota bacterium]